MGDIGDDDVAAYAAYDARKLTAHEVGTWPAFRDGYAAGLAARTPGPDVSRLLAAAKELLKADDHPDTTVWLKAYDRFRLIVEAAAKGAGG